MKKHLEIHLGEDYTTGTIGDVTVFTKDYPTEKVQLMLGAIAGRYNIHTELSSLAQDHLYAHSADTPDDVRELLASKYCDDDAPTTDRIRKEVGARLASVLQRAAAEA